MTWQEAGSIATGAVVGAIVAVAVVAACGATAGIACAVAAGALAGAAGSAASYGTEVATHQHAFNFNDFLKQTATGAVIGGLTAGIAKALTNITTPASTSAETAAADAVPGNALLYPSKIESQMGSRGWNHELVAATVESPSETHSVWDFTAGDKQPATAYVQRGGGYVVVNDGSRQVVQVSDLGASDWKPVWKDPRFQR